MKDIRIIGAGTMGTSIAARLAGSLPLSFYDKQLGKAQAAAEQLHVKAASSPFDTISADTIILLAIKPQDFPGFIRELKKASFTCRYFVSILAGISLASLKEVLPNIPILRMMPNLAVQYGQGVVALAESEQIDPFRSEVQALFSPLGLLKWMPESRFDAITSLTGSGPGFVCVLIEAMVDAAIAMGIPAQEALPLVKQMLAGTLHLLEQTHQLPAELKWQITSPAGTTIQGVRMLEEKGVRSGLIETFFAAFKRAQELSQNK